jgi:oligopeptide transport system substrate-binding protein
MKWISFVFVCFLLFQGCISPRESKVFLSEGGPLTVTELRWSNGKKPKSFDPAKAFASPEVDIVRAIFKGLTDIDPKTLKAIPAIAETWESSEDYKVWTFHLRKDAKWINGELVTAKDFVKSWQRIVSLSNSVPHRRLFKNIVGMDTEKVLSVFATQQHREAEESEQMEENKEGLETYPATTEETKSKNFFGVEAIDDFTLRVSLVYPDPDFPLLVAHTVFYPVYQGGQEFKKNDLTTKLTTNGAFRLASIEENEIILEKNSFYWESSELALDRIRIISFEDSEEALQAYKNGQVDVITNMNLKPLALRLLSSFDDFYQTVHSAVNLYQFNTSSKPFDDPRVREALAISIEREQIVEDEVFVKPALSYLPISKFRIREDIHRAKMLLSEAGFPNGENFPTIRLLINRNDMQRRVARSIAKMWEKNLNVKADIIVKESKELEAAIKNGDFDIVRRGVVLPTLSETASMILLFPNDKLSSVTVEEIVEGMSEEVAESNELEKFLAAQIITKEEDALKELPAIPIYFPVASALVKPYVKNFSLNAFDIFLLEKVYIEKAN